MSSSASPPADALPSPSPPLSTPAATALAPSLLPATATLPSSAPHDFAIVTEVGPEVLAGSSRMKAGTAHKMVLNMISTGAMTRLGYVYGNLMVSVWTKNEKLVQRSIRILEQATGADHDAASRALKESGNRTPVALVMLAANVNKTRAAAALKKSKGHTRQAIALAQS